LRFVERRVHPSQAEDIAAEVFLVLWRRLDDVPADREDARAWVFGVARRILMARMRGEQRRQALAVRIAVDRHAHTYDGLDAAETGADVDVGADPRARTILTGVLAAPLAPGDSGPPAPAVERYRRRFVRGVVALGAVVAAIAAVSIAVPHLVEGDQALAWSAVPEALPADAAREAEEACIAYVLADPSPVEGVDRSRMRPVITEARGSLVLVYLTDRAASPSEATCYVRDGSVEGMTGSLATPQSPPAPPVPANSILVGLGEVASTPSGSIRGIRGRVGSNVVGVVFHTVAKGAVTATVRDGHVAAWWPDAATTEAQESAHTAPEISGATVTLRDGSTREVSVEELSWPPTDARPDTGGSAS
jgi:hypothetical protein